MNCFPFRDGDAAVNKRGIRAIVYHFQELAAAFLFGAHKGWDSQGRPTRPPGCGTMAE